MEIKKTSLNKLHQDNQAKFVEFAGYEMPIQYSKGVIEEHKFTRAHAGIFDVSHMGQLFVYGNENLTSDLEKIFPLDLKNLQQNCSKYSFLMNEEAGVYDDLIITKLKDGYLIILNEIINGVKDLTFMTGNWFEFNDQKVFVTRSGYTGEDGFEVSIINDEAEEFTKSLINKGAKLIGLGARDTLRLEAGLCLYGHELDLNKTPVEANLKWAISKERLSNGGFVGSDKIMSQIKKGAKQIRVGIKPEGRLIAREKTKIFNLTETPIGEITSGTFGPSVNGPIAMGYIDKEFSKIDTKILLEVRGKKYPANICKLPFYKKNYVKGVN